MHRRYGFALGALDEFGDAPSADQQDEQRDEGRAR